MRKEAKRRTEIECPRWSSGIDSIDDHADACVRIQTQRTC